MVFTITSKISKTHRSLLNRAAAKDAELGNVDSAAVVKVGRNQYASLRVVDGDLRDGDEGFTGQKLIEHFTHKAARRAMVYAHVTFNYELQA